MPTNASLRKQMEWRGRHEDPPTRSKPIWISEKPIRNSKKSRQELAHFGQLLADHARGPAAFPKISDMTADHRAIYMEELGRAYKMVLVQMAE